MPRLGLLNLVIGFALIFFAACFGAFVATEITDGYLRDKALLETWRLLLEKSAHGHTNLFGLTHVAFGLTMPYSVFSQRTKMLQTTGLALGSFAMAVVMLVRGAVGPVDGIDLTEIVIGCCLSCALAAIGTHVLGLAAKLRRTP